MSEESNWNRFQQESAKRRMKYDKNLPANCEGCMSGERWLESEMLTLVSLLKEGNNSLATFCFTLNRPKFGIISKLQKMGLAIVAHQRGRGHVYYKAHAVDYMSRKRFNGLPEKVQALLIDRGWQVGRYVVAPRWWRDAIINDDVRRHQ